MKFDKLSANITPHTESLVTVTKMGNITEVRYMTCKPKIRIRKLDKDSYVELCTGEIKEFKHTESRAENKTNVAQSLKRLRDLINTNVTDVRKCLWITLTYAENMTDTEHLYNDFRKFNMRLRYYAEKNGFPKYEYIVACEPQARGAWHMHLLLIFDKISPFIPNKELANIWGNGFVKINSLKDVDNLGAYLSAYLGDMDVSEIAELENLGSIRDSLIRNTQKEIESVGKDGARKTKAILKGARLNLYPTGFRLFRKSKGIIEPNIIECSNGKAMEYVGNSKLTYEKTISISDDDGNVINVINYRHYNKKGNNSYRYSGR